jgi:NAD(P)H-dependent flavin oxidoreductase YrpB (nitropropane dioxygenase family)
MSTLRTRFTDAFGIDRPIAQAGMAFAGMTPSLAIAVGNAGGLGSFGVGLLPPPVVADMVGAIRGGTTAPLNVNFITCYTEQSHIDMLSDVRPAMASFHWGHPSAAWVDQLHAAGVKVAEQVGSVDAALAAVADGVDVVVAQGHEAGGHNYGQTPTMSLVPDVVDAVGDRALVLAAGGIADGRQLAAALVLGADGVWMGTRLVATQESAARSDYKDRLTAVRGTDTVITHMFGKHHPDFNPMRVVRNGVVTEWHDRTAEIPDDNSGEPVIGTFDFGPMHVDLHRFSNLVPMEGMTAGDIEELPLLSGTSVGQVHDVPTVAELFDRLMTDATAHLRRVGGDGSVAP